MYHVIYLAQASALHMLLRKELFCLHDNLVLMQEKVARLSKQTAIRNCNPKDTKSVAWEVSGGHLLTDSQHSCMRANPHLHCQSVTKIVACLLGLLFGVCNLASMNVQPKQDLVNPLTTP